MFYNTKLYIFKNLIKTLLIPGIFYNKINYIIVRYYLILFLFRFYNKAVTFIF